MAIKQVNADGAICLPGTGFCASMARPGVSWMHSGSSAITEAALNSTPRSALSDSASRYMRTGLIWMVWARMRSVFTGASTV